MLLFKKRKVIARFQPNDVCPIVNAQLFSKDVFVLIDSGSDICYIDRDFFNSIEYSGELNASKSIISAGGETASYGKIKTEITIGNSNYELPMTVYNLKDRFVAFKSIQEGLLVGIIGSDFLFVYHMILNFHNQTLIEYR